MKETLAAILLLMASALCPAQTRTDRAVTSAGRYILSRIGEDGACKDEYPKKNLRHGGKTMLCIYALLSSGLDYRKTPRLGRAIDWARSAELHGTYAVALRTLALRTLKDDRAAAGRVAEDMRWLLRAAYANGSYTYGSAGGRAITPAAEFDNSNSQWAVFAVASAGASGVKIPPDYWKRVTRHWLAEQQPDGGWGYRTHVRGGKKIARTYGSITAAGTATLAICLEHLGRQRIKHCRAVPQYEALEKGLGWLNENFSAETNPRKNQEWYYQWLFYLHRAATPTGRKYLGGVDWYAAAASRLLGRQNDDGSWGYSDRTCETCFALLFLARRQGPTLVNKVRYPGRWNARPRDAANFVRWLGYTYERRLGWQVVDIDVESPGWRDGRIAYISGAGPINLNDRQVRRLRLFVDRGGIILSEAACDNGDFTRGMYELYRRIFPRYRIKRLGRTHPLYNLQFTKTSPDGLMGVSNGVRLLAVHSPRDISLELELGASPGRRATFNMLANLYLYLTNKGATDPRGGPPRSPCDAK